jgi:16S rRNA (uracil1498-N3)-methyltransferase
MAHLHRFYISPDTDAEGEIRLSGDEGHHALRVIRVQQGERVVLIDGAGREITGIIAEAGRREIVVTPEHERRVPPPQVQLTLIQAWLHKDKSMESLIEHGTELGVHRFVFFRAQRSERPVSLNERWNRIALEACKQCGRLWMPHFEAAPSLMEAMHPAHDSLLIATRDLDPVPLQKSISGHTIALVVGPEGDFTGEELRLLAGHGGVPVSFGSTTFRAEMAGIYGAALILYETGNMGPR